MTTSADKKAFLQQFDAFLEQFGSLHYGKCYFRLLDGRECQGWIGTIGDTIFEYTDSGPLSREEPYYLAIADIDPGSFAYWDNDISRWTEYARPDKWFNRTLKQ
ncbi:hypothetical protein [Taibaiella helva]|uniref:hypothetical protein n=1 Tax=Taibaiella helva TaxID=2301235 RepID=UPI000E57D786|nr:hypothetical protein [Taibaiella helva]